MLNLYCVMFNTRSKKHEILKLFFQNEYPGIGIKYGRRGSEGDREGENKRETEREGQRE